MLYYFMSVSYTHLVLYEMTKEVSKRKMCRQKFSTYERVLMCASIENYDEGPVIV